MNNSPQNTVDKVLRESYAPELPYGFAERVARAAMAEVHASFLSIILSWTPQTTLAMGTAAIALFVFGMTGSGPNVFESISNYASLSNVFQVP